MFKKHDGVVLRRNSDYSVDLFTKSGWKAFPEKPGGDIRDSSVAAWFEGTELTEFEAKDEMKKLAN